MHPVLSCLEGHRQQPQRELTQLRTMTAAPILTTGLPHPEISLALRALPIDARDFSAYISALTLAAASQLSFLMP